MSTVGFLYDDVFLLHEPPSWHPDSPDRLVNIIATLKAAGLWARLTPIKPRMAGDNELLRVHTRDHIERMRHLAPGEADPDTYLSAGTFDAALHAAGAVIEAVDQSRQGMRCLFCAVRPPGHHAEADKAMGFCIFNNVAVGAAHARATGYGKVFIIDFDAHHGNGTQHIFEEDDSVFYFSTHQYPYYPDTGKDMERGRGPGEGYTYNVPILAGSGNKEYLAVYQDILPGVVERFGPDLILVSAGYDIHANDPHANIRVTHEGIHAIIRSILACADVPVIFVLEGGYDHPSLCDSVRITIEEMLKG
ncbi:MAG: histone deacetylase [Nitrospirota bacterium]|nr:histone deacetylase [Nitrospirota bacterium]